MKTFTDKLGALLNAKGNRPQDQLEDEEDKARTTFVEKMERLHHSRKKFKSTLFDAIRQRNGLMESFTIQNKLEEEKDDAVY